MRNVKYLNFLWFIWSLLITGCSNDRTKYYEESNCYESDLSQKYSNNDLRFAIQFPEDYVINENLGVLHLAAIKDSDDSVYLEAFGVTVEDNLLNYNLEEFYNVSFTNDEEDYQKDYENFELVDQGKQIVNDFDALWNIYHYDHETALNYFFIFQGKTYRMIFLSNDGNFDSLSCKFSRIVRSIDFY